MGDQLRFMAMSLRFGLIVWILFDYNMAFADVALAHGQRFPRHANAGGIAAFSLGQATFRGASACPI